MLHITHLLSREPTAEEKAQSLTDIIFVVDIINKTRGQDHQWFLIMTFHAQLAFENVLYRLLLKFHGHNRYI
ncbi:hypothetical protein [Candidatus Bealeia paramacronuclearis]|uniref:hypothetical protein n=1 Tax=Candidatus Bealeia paramacronuclearis TaxID=1921001 RepID=UPI002F2620B7